MRGGPIGGKSAPDKRSKVRVIKKTMAGVNEERVFQGDWEKEDGTALTFFSNVIPDIQKYVDNWMTCPASNIHWFLIKKECVEEDVENMLKKCFSPEELIKIGKVSYNGPMVVLKESFHPDMTAMVRNLRQFEMDRGLSKEEKLSRAQQAATSGVLYSVAHRVPGTFNFEFMFERFDLFFDPLSQRWFWQSGGLAVAIVCFE